MQKVAQDILKNGRAVETREYLSSAKEILALFPEPLPDDPDISYTYDERDRLLSRTDPDSTPSDPTDNPVVSYTYDAAGNRTSLTIPSGTTSYTYDVLNRISRDFSASIDTSSGG